MKNLGMRGITIMELLVVMVIMALTAGFASLSMEMIRRERVASASRELYADLQKARIDTMTQAGSGFGIRLASDHSYVIFRFNDCDEDYTYDTNTCAGNGREETDVVARALHSSVVLRKTNPSTLVDNDVRIFDRFGSPRRASGGMGLITILVKNEPDSGLAKCISMSMNRIREGVWSGSDCI